ncbi:MAG: tetratricopeptide repeat protein [Bacteroidia bacterium]|nr:tetratricopeptide repeat protein [Bacteroidia bacterium]
MRKLITFLIFYILVLMPWFLLAKPVKTTGPINRTIDSLQNRLKTLGTDTSKVNTLNELSWQYITSGSYVLAGKYAQDALHAAENLNFKKGIGASYNNIGITHWYQGNYEKALENYLKALKIRQEIGDKKGIASSYGNIGIIYETQGEYRKALDNHLKALKIQEESGDKNGISNCYNNIGGIYLRLGNYEKSLENYQKCLEICELMANKTGVAISYNNIGIIYRKQVNYEKALINYSNSLEIAEEINFKPLISSALGNIGLVYSDQGNYKKALDNYLKCLKISEEIGNKQGIGLSYINIGITYAKLDRFDESYNNLNQSLRLFKEIGYKEEIKNVYSALSDLFEKKGDFKQSYNYHKLYSDIKDSLLNEQSTKQIAEMNTKYDSEKKDKDLIKKDAEIIKQQAETEKQILQRNTFIIGFALVLILSFFIYNGYRNKQTANKLLEETNSLIEYQKHLVEEKNLKITKSINYAKQIQQAILPSRELIKSFLPESFIFFRPKDIVSGDFYWFSEKQDKLLIAIADCTGHGVPGAFMSMIGNTLLNEIVNVKNIVEPAQILNQLNNGIVSLLHQGETLTTQDDGMDITILSIDKTNNQIEFAGANHFSYLIKQNQLETLTGDIFSIGGMFGRSDINFTSKKISVQKGSTIYLFTDGFVDQFGGEKNTKFLSSRFEQLLKTIQQHNLEEQHKKLIVSFDDWKGNNKQLDDVLVVGIRL